MLVAPGDKNVTYDKGAKWQAGDGGWLAQEISSQPDAGLIQFIQSSTTG